MKTNREEFEQKDHDESLTTFIDIKIFNVKLFRLNQNILLRIHIFLILTLKYRQSLQIRFEDALIHLRKVKILYLTLITISYSGH